MKEPKYTLIHGGDILREGNNKAELIAQARKETKPCTVFGKNAAIIYENKAQRKINNQ